MRPEQIIVVIPGRTCHVEDNYDEEEEMEKDLPIINPEAFEDEIIMNKVHGMLEAMGVRIVKNALLMQIMEDEEKCLEEVLFKLLDIPDEEESSQEELEGIDEQND